MTMKKPVLITLVCSTLILITPFTVVAHENKITSNLIEESNVDRLIAQILQIYEHNQIVSKIGDFILFLLELIGKIVNFIFKIIIVVIAYIILLIIA